MRNDTQVGGELITNRQPERTGWFQYAMQFAHPIGTPTNIGFVFVRVVVLVVLKTNVERRIGERQVDRLGLQRTEKFYTIAVMNGVNGGSGSNHCGVLSARESGLWHQSLSYKRNCRAAAGQSRIAELCGNHR